MSDKPVLLNTGWPPTHHLGLLSKDAQHSLTAWRAGEQWPLLNCAISLKLGYQFAEALGFTRSPRL